MSRQIHHDKTSSFVPVLINATHRNILLDVNRSYACCTTLSTNNWIDGYSCEAQCGTRNFG